MYTRPAALFFILVGIFPVCVHEVEQSLSSGRVHRKTDSVEHDPIEVIRP